MFKYWRQGLDITQVYEYIDMVYCNVVVHIAEVYINIKTINMKPKSNPLLDHRRPDYTVAS